MSYESKKGYTAERAVEVMWNERGRPVMRPRAGAAADVGDLVGLPFVQSVKNHARLDLATWVTGLNRQVVNAGMNTGVVWVKKRGAASPYGWYVVLNGALALPLLETYCDALAGK
jgi:hypothetical protein